MNSENNNNNESKKNNKEKNCGCKTCQFSVAFIMNWPIYVIKHSKIKKLSWFCTRNNRYIQKKSINSCMFKQWAQAITTIRQK